MRPARNRIIDDLKLWLCYRLISMAIWLAPSNREGVLLVRTLVRLSLMQSILGLSDEAVAKQRVRKARNAQPRL